MGGSSTAMRGHGTAEVPELRTRPSRRRHTYTPLPLGTLATPFCARNHSAHCSVSSAVARHRKSSSSGWGTCAEAILSSSSSTSGTSRQPLVRSCSLYGSAARRLSSMNARGPAITTTRATPRISRTVARLPLARESLSLARFSSRSMRVHCDSIAFLSRRYRNPKKPPPPKLMAMSCITVRSGSALGAPKAEPMMRGMVVAVAMVAAATRPL
mmetsp:Transcript_2411/g.8699  ORF Transcript_2411/g.8699 Transcript_2411/m.8699 type:complete len:213 (+) Transcript_2411:1617-2255(+)